LQFLVDLVPLGQNLVQLGLADDVAQRGLGDQRGGPEVVEDLDHRIVGIDHPEVDNGVHADRHVVARDHLLRGNVHRDHAQVYFDHAIHDWDDEEQAGPLSADQPAEAEDHAPFVLLDDLDRCSDNPDQDQERHSPECNKLHDFTLLKN